MSLLACLLAFQMPSPTVTVKLDAASAVVGRPVKGTLTLVLPEGMHGYQNPPADEFENPIKLSVTEIGFKLGKVAYPKGVSLAMAGAEKPSMVYEGTVRIPFTLFAVKPSPKGMTTNVNFKVEYQLCTMQNCYPPSSLIAKAPLKVAPAPKKAKP